MKGRVCHGQNSAVLQLLLTALCNCWDVLVSPGYQPIPLCPELSRTGVSELDQSVLYMVVLGFLFPLDLSLSMSAWSLSAFSPRCSCWNWEHFQGLVCGVLWLISITVSVGNGESSFSKWTWNNLSWKILLEVKYCSLSETILWTAIRWVLWLP